MTRSRSSAMRWIERGSEPRLGLDPHDFDSDQVKGLMRRVGLLFGDGRWFPVDVRGWENVPPPPSLLVSNHSGGLLIPDVWGFGYAWHRHFQFARPMHVLAHELVFSLSRLGRIFARAGVLRAQPDLGARVLSEWRRDLLVYPGGDVDVWRPYRERYQVKFAARRGYARLALRSGVPVVPVAHAGAHETLRVLTDGARLARLLRLHKLFRARVFPVHLSLPWGLAIGPLPHFPPPTELRYRIGPPILPDPHFSTARTEPPADCVEDFDRRVQAAIQNLLDQLQAEAPGMVSR